VRIQSQVVAKDPRCFLGCDLGQERYVIKDGGDVVYQGKQASSGHSVRSLTAKSISEFAENTIELIRSCLGVG